MSIGTRIRARRESLGFTQKELAARIDVTEQLISLWELDRRSPSAEKLAELSNMLGVTTDYLIKGEETGANFAPLRPPYRSKSTTDFGALRPLLSI